MTENNSSGSSRRPIVLVVDDHCDTRELYTQALGLFGYATIEASDGFEAWEKANQILPDVIVTDVGLPRMDGMELCGRLKASGPTSHIPIIALTGFGEAAVAERARALGIAKVLVKPCPPDLLLSEVSGLCSADGGAPSGPDPADG